jgi:phytanoyl-CoA hydroxylase
VEETSTCTCSLAIDNSTEENGCLRYVPGSGLSRTLRQHAPLTGSRDEGHALKLEVSKGDFVKLAPCKRGSITVHDEFVVHGSSGNMSANSQRRTYVLAYRPKKVVEAERKLGFTHSHNDEVNWDTFEDGEDRK